MPFKYYIIFIFPFKEFNECIQFSKKKNYFQLFKFTTKFGIKKIKNKIHVQNFYFYNF